MLVLLIVARWGGLRWDTAICRRKWSDLSTFPTVNRHQRVIQFVKFLTLPLLLLRIDPSTNTVSSIRLNLRATQTSLWDRSNEVKIKWLPDNKKQIKIIVQEYTFEYWRSTNCYCIFAEIQMKTGEDGPGICTALDFGDSCSEDGGDNYN